MPRLVVEGNCVHLRDPVHWALTLLLRCCLLTAAHEQVHKLCKTYGIYPGHIAETEEGDDQVRRLYAAHKGAATWLADMSAALGGVGERPLVKRLQALRLLPKDYALPSRKSAVAPALLRQLYDEYKDWPDMLNLIAAGLPVPVSAKGVDKLLRKHGIVHDAAHARKRAKDLEERATLQALYVKYQGDPDQLARIAGEMPGVVGPAQVSKLLRKHGIVGGGGGRGTRGTHGPSQHGPSQRGAAEAFDELFGAAAHGVVPEPVPDRVLGCLQAVHNAAKASPGALGVLSAQQAVDWILSKLDAAEQIFAATAPPHIDYSLAPMRDLDFDFFCMDVSNQLLEAAGIRNDMNDYFKVPGNSDAAWRQRMRAVLQVCAQQLNNKEHLHVAGIPTCIVCDKA